MLEVKVVTVSDNVIIDRGASRKTYPEYLALVNGMCMAHGVPVGQTHSLTVDTVRWEWTASNGQRCVDNVIARVV